MEEEIRRLQEEVRQQMRDFGVRQRQKEEEEQVSYTVKIKWRIPAESENCPNYDHDTLHRILSKVYSALSKSN